MKQMESTLTDPGNKPVQLEPTRGEELNIEWHLN